MRTPHTGHGLVLVKGDSIPLEREQVLNNWNATLAELREAGVSIQEWLEYQQARQKEDSKG